MINYLARDVVVAKDLTVQLFSAGQTLGGAYYVLSGSSEKVIYCVDYSVRPTRIVEGMNMNEIIKVSDV